MPNPLPLNISMWLRLRMAVKGKKRNAFDSSHVSESAAILPVTATLLAVNDGIVYGAGGKQMSTRGMMQKVLENHRE